MCVHSSFHRVSVGPCWPCDGGAPVGALVPISLDRSASWVGDNMELNDSEDGEIHHYYNHEVLWQRIVDR